MNSSTPKLRWEQLEIPGLMEQLPKVSDSNKDKSAETQNKQVPQNKTILNPPSDWKSRLHKRSPPARTKDNQRFSNLRRQVLSV